MKTINTMLIGGVVATAQLAQGSDEIAIYLKDLPQIGISPKAIQEAYRQQANVDLNWDEVLKVSSNEEGNHINVNTIGGIAITLPITAAVGPENKGDIPSPN